MKVKGLPHVDKILCQSHAFTVPTDRDGPTIMENVIIEIIGEF